jgi:hypothetical protein
MLKEGLSHYLLEIYRCEFGSHWEAEIRSATRQFKHLDFRTEEGLIASLDTQGCLDLILKRRDVFTRRLGRVGLAYATELLETRNTLGHERPFTLEDVLRACDTVARLLDLISASDLAHEARELARSLRTPASPSEPEQRTFAWQIMTQLFQLGQTITALTEDQFRILEWLRSYRRAAVSGCAGSGKTLVAMEKALRLDRAGFATLVLCHNPFLARYLRSLAAQSRVRVFDFAEWVGALIGRPVKRR